MYMHMEIEAKIEVENLDVYAERLKKLGGHFEHQCAQRDYFFDYPDRRLLRADCGLRLRQQTDDKHEEIMLCYKGPRDADSVYKRRQEVEFAVGKLTAAHRFLEALGFEVTIAFEKRRSLWRLADCTVCLDQVVELGFFIEIEGPSEEAVAEVQAKLQLQDAQHLTTSYAVMLAEHLQKTNRPSSWELFF